MTKQTQDDQITALREMVFQILRQTGPVRVPYKLIEEGRSNPVELIVNIDPDTNDVVFDYEEHDA